MSIFWPLPMGVRASTAVMPVCMGREIVAMSAICVDTPKMGHSFPGAPAWAVVVPMMRPKASSSWPSTCSDIDSVALFAWTIAVE